MNRFRVVLLVALIFGLINYPARIRGEGMTIQKGSQASFNYTLTVDGEVVDSSEGKEPLQYTHGEGQIIPGLSKQLEGMRVGEEKKGRDTSGRGIWPNKSCCISRSSQVNIAR